MMAAQVGGPRALLNSGDGKGTQVAGNGPSSGVACCNIYSPDRHAHVHDPAPLLPPASREQADSGSRTWAPATSMGGWKGIPGSQLLPGPVPCNCDHWGVNQWMGFLKLQNKKISIIFSVETAGK